MRVKADSGAVVQGTFGTAEMIELVTKNIRPRLPKNVDLGIKMHYDAEVDDKNAAAVVDALASNKLYLAMITPGVHSHFAYGGINSLEKNERKVAEEPGYARSIWLTAHCARLSNPTSPRPSSSGTARSAMISPASASGRCTRTSRKASSDCASTRLAKAANFAPGLSPNRTRDTRRCSCPPSPAPSCTDWRKFIEHKDIDIRDVNDVDKEIAVGAATGKMILCEKLLAMNSRESGDPVKLAYRMRLASRMG